MSKPIRLRVRRQEKPDTAPYWEEFEIPYREQHNVVSALMAIREQPHNAEGKPVAPVIFECNCMEEVCGACAMLVNGKPRQACSALVDQLEQPIVLEPLRKFPVVRDLAVDRAKAFNGLRKAHAWIDIDGSWDVHEGSPRISPQQWDLNYAFSRCMTCCCCMEACPQYGEGLDFVGPAVLGQVFLMNSHPTGKWFAKDRLHAIMGEGGLSDCGNAQNCLEACPKEIPLTTAIGKLGRATTLQMLKDLFGD